MKATALPPRHSRSQSAIFTMVGRLVWAVLAALLVDPSRAGAIGAPALLPSAQPLTQGDWPHMEKGARHSHDVAADLRPRT